MVDGDTIELGDGRLVRYLGVDAPEVRRREGERWVREPEPYGLEAQAANVRWVQGKAVRLEYDVRTHDRHGRLLAYVYRDGRMINAELLEEGYARVLIIPPNLRHAARLRRAAAEARKARRGLWGLPEEPQAEVGEESLRNAR